jgi:hypothetical protein
MFTEAADALVWLIRLALVAGLAWGGWLCLAHSLLPARSQKTLPFEHFATFALLVLLATTLGGFLHAG